MTKALNPLTIPVNEQLHLAAILRSDRDELVKHLNDRDIYERTLRIPAPYTAADADRFLAVVEESNVTHGHPVHFAIRNAEDKLIGGCGFSGLTHGHGAEIGYWLARPHWGRGIMTDTVRTISRFACDEWKLVRITAHVFDFNKASARVLEKSGYRREGYLRKHFCKDGRFLDSILYALVK